LTIGCAAPVWIRFNGSNGCDGFNCGSRQKPVEHPVEFDGIIQVYQVAGTRNDLVLGMRKLALQESRLAQYQRAVAGAVDQQCGSGEPVQPGPAKGQHGPVNFDHLLSRNARHRPAGVHPACQGLANPPSLTAQAVNPAVQCTKISGAQGPDRGRGHGTDDGIQEHFDRPHKRREGRVAQNEAPDPLRVQLGKRLCNHPAQ
jgi:hypothetical protein